MKVAFASVVVLVACFVAATWWALEADGVAIVHTQAPEANARETHVWYAQAGGELWLEAGTPENGWYRDILQHPALRFEFAGGSQELIATPIEGPRGHARIRALMRAKYGFRDWWVNLLIDTSRSVAVRLDSTRAAAKRPDG